MQTIRYDGDVNENMMTQKKTVGQKKQHGNHTSRDLPGHEYNTLRDREVAALAQAEGVC